MIWVVFVESGWGIREVRVGFCGDWEWNVRVLDWVWGDYVLSVSIL
jgi:hypothetical protein